MLRKGLIPVWAGILALSGMFLMGQDTWGPQPPVPVQIELCQKGDACSEPPPSGDWACDAAGGSGGLGYLAEGPTFSFDAEAVVPRADTDYVLIYYPDPWPGNGLICLGGPTTSGADGSIALSGAAVIGTDLPIASDENVSDGAKLWLVPADMVDCEGQVMANWSDCPGILFEKDIGNRVFYTFVTP